MIFDKVTCCKTEDKIYKREALTMLIYLVSGLLILGAKGQDLTCKDGCNRPYDPRGYCHCDQRCVFFDNCCIDHEQYCDNEFTQCATACKSELPDIFLCQNCSFQSYSCVTDGELRSLTAELWKLSTYKPTESHFQIGDGNKTKFFVSVRKKVLRHASFRKVSKLFRGYLADWRRKEPNSPLFEQKERAFLDHFMLSEIGKATYTFLTAKGLSGCGNESDFKHILWQLWFRKYMRKGSKEIGSSGFENVFVGERGESQGSGLNHWLRLFLLERKGRIAIKPVKTITSAFRKLTYTRNGKIGETAIFIGASPQWEFAVYTLCLMLRAHRRCGIATQDWDGTWYNASIVSEYGRLYRLAPWNGLSSISNIYALD